MKKEEGGLTPSFFCAVRTFPERPEQPDDPERPEHPDDPERPEQPDKQENPEDLNKSTFFARQPAGF